MREILIRPTARRQFSEQIDYIHERSPQGAMSLAVRFNTFLTEFLTNFPETGTHIPEKDIWEISIARTKLIVWYRFDDKTLRVLSVWHGAQDRQSKEV